MTSIGKVTPLILPRLENLRAQFPLLSNSSYPLVRRIVRSKSGDYFHASMGVSISTLREEFKKYIQPFVDDVSKCGTQCEV